MNYEDMEISLGHAKTRITENKAKQSALKNRVIDLEEEMAKLKDENAENSLQISRL